MHAATKSVAVLHFVCCKYSTKRASTDCVVLARYAYGLVVYLFNWMKEAA